MNESAKRPAIAFRLHELDDRESALFRSFLRLIGSSTSHCWVEKSSGAEVWVVPAGRKVSAPGGLQLLSLLQPIHAGALEQTLDQLGERVLAARQGVAAVAMPPAVRLLRWPPQAMMHEAQRMRLATMMTGRAWAPAFLCARAGVSPDYLQQFLDDLRVAGLLADSHVMPQPPARGLQALPGLIGRIRDRLGLKPAHRS